LKEKEESVLDKTLEEMESLSIQMAAFLSEMQEFKKTVLERIANLESTSRLCQTNPSTCATARKLDEHVAHDSGKLGKNTALICCIISCLNMAISLVVLIAKGGM